MNAVKPVPGRFAILALGIGSLLAAMWAGLLRLGWHLPPIQPALTLDHGPLMVCGFLGTVIALERAVGLGKGWAYASPVLTGTGAVALLAGLPVPVGATLISLGSAVFVAVLLAIVRQQVAQHTLVMVAGGVVWLVGNLLWLSGVQVPMAVPWWAGFLILIIAAERLELSRLVGFSPLARNLFLAAGAFMIGGLFVTLVDFDLGMRIAGIGLLALATWLLRNDLARRSVRLKGLTRFIAVCLLVGYVWLGVAGAMILSWGGVMAGARYDAALHAIFLGFVISMIFGHAPIIFPAVLGVPVPYRSGFYLHLWLLHLSLLVRVTGDVAGWLAVRQWGGMLNVFALILFLINTATAQLRAPPAVRGSGA